MASNKLSHLRVIKVGGHESDQQEFLTRFSEALAQLDSCTVIVHGGGSAISELEKTILNRDPIFIEGKRQTDSETLRLAEMVLCGSVNKNIVRALLRNAKLKSIGISAQDAELVVAERDENLGLVAKDLKVNPEPIRHLCALGYTPVIAPLVLGSSGETLNANADDVAAAVAQSLGAQELIFVTNVPGVMIDGVIIQSLDKSRAQELIETGQISGGMVVKVQSALQAACSSGLNVKICNVETLVSGDGTIVRGDFQDEVQNPRHINVKTNRNSALAPLFSKFPMQCIGGEGAHLFDAQGHHHLDFASGIAVNALGYRHPRITQTLVENAQHPLHLSNLFYIDNQEILAQKLTSSCFAERVFFSNSGTEANEAALKFALKYHYSRSDNQRHKLIAFSGGFHGRTLGSLAVTEKIAYREPFASHLFDVEFLTFNSIEGLSKVLDQHVAAVIVEPIQGEAGVRVATSEFLSEIKRLCVENGILLIFDEVQCGLMRTGQMWAHQDYRIDPDILTTAKPLGGGLPLGATLISQRIAEGLAVGDHGSTFGGNPLVCALANVVFEEVQKLQKSVQKYGEELAKILQELQLQFPQWINSFRGRGLMWGIDVRCASAEFIELAREQRLILVSAGAQTIRLLPPLIVGAQELSEFKSKMSAILGALNCKYCDGIRIRNALESDARDIYKLIIPSVERRQLLPRSLESIQRGIQSFFVAEWNGVLVGCISYREWNEFFWEVRSLVVAPNIQLMGVGQKLMNSLVEAACFKKIPEVFALTVCPEFFQKIGFKKQMRSKYEFKEQSDCVQCAYATDCRETAVGLELHFVDVAKQPSILGEIHP